MQQCYDVHSVPVRVQWSDAVLGAILETILQYFGLEASASTAPRGAAVTLRFITDVSPPGVPPGIVEAAQFDAGLKAWRDEDHLFLGDGASLAVLDPAAGTGAAYVRPLLKTAGAARRRTLTGLLVLSLFMLLRPRQLYPLHAAALAHAGTGVLLAAPSDSGKSTLAYGLVRAGWRFLSDDSVLLRPGPAVVEALAFRRDFGLDPDAADLFPEIAGVHTSQLADAEKWCVPVETLYPAQAARRCVPRLLLLPHIVDAPRSRLVPVSKTDALLAALRQSALVTLEPRRATAHLDVVKRLVQQAPAYALHAGRDLKAEPSCLAALLKEALPHEAAPVSSPSDLNEARYE